MTRARRAPPAPRTRRDPQARPPRSRGANGSARPGRVRSRWIRSASGGPGKAPIARKYRARRAAGSMFRLEDFPALTGGCLHQRRRNRAMSAAGLPSLDRMERGVGALRARSHVRVMLASRRRPTPRHARGARSPHERERRLTGRGCTRRAPPCARPPREPCRHRERASRCDRCRACPDERASP